MSTSRAHGALDFGLNEQPLLAPLARWALALPAIAALYRQSLSRGERGRFVENALAAMGVTVAATPEELRKIPPAGPLLIVANHPFGGIDGLALLSIARRVRPDVKLLANHFLRVFPELGETSLFVDPFGGAGATARNLRPMRQALRWVRGGGALVVFPAGEVSHLNLRRRAVQDGPWHVGVARLASRAGAAVVPVLIEGRNSGLFQCAGLLHPILRTLLLPREMLRMRNHSITARVGSAISPERLARLGSDRERVDYLRVRTEILRARANGAGRIVRAVPKQALEPIVAPVDPLRIAAEVRQLPGDRCVGESGDFAVHFARASEIPATLREIGRLREITFRGVGEGTGRAIDLDRFDEYYLHLFVWNRRRREIVGAYRLGPTDEILSTRGPDGLYTSTLFRFRKPLLSQISPAIELGRSFVRGEYQREFAPLLLLWKGIGQFVARHPKYRRLFGPVSISSEYSSLTRQLLISFLTITSSVPALARLVSPRNPPKRFGPGRRWESSLLGTVVRSIDDVDALVAEIESDRRGVPVLLRQYLKLGAKLLGFNVDPDFGDVLDGLMLVDLLEVEPAVLDRYMGKDGATRFRANHSTTSLNRQSDRALGPASR